MNPLSERTAIYVTAFVKHMEGINFDAGEKVLLFINKLMDDHERN